MVFKLDNSFFLYSYIIHAILFKYMLYLFIFIFCVDQIISTRKL